MVYCGRRIDELGGHRRDRRGRGCPAVVVPIVYLAVQIRQNTRSTKLSVEKDIATAWADIGIDLSPTSIPYIYVRGAEDLTKLSDEELAQFGFFVPGMFRQFQLAYDQRCDGNLSDRSWASIESWLQSQYQSRGVRAFWEVRRNTFKKDFQNYIGTIEIDESRQSAAQAVRKALNTFQAREE